VHEQKGEHASSQQSKSLSEIAFTMECSFVEDSKASAHEMLVSSKTYTANMAVRIFTDSNI
jgi:hypothetical protein